MGPGPERYDRWGKSAEPPIASSMYTSPASDTLCGKAFELPVLLWHFQAIIFEDAPI